MTPSPGPADPRPGARSPAARRGWTRSRSRCTSHVESEAGFVTEAARHLLEAGGKRFRPLLVLLAAETGDPDADGVLTSACVVELTHLASLYHDDVMDEADLRRGAESANARWDNHVAILTGDFLFSKSSELTAELGADAVRIQAQTFTRLVEGQILETLGPTDGQDPLEHYLRVVAGKTGSLIATSARYGARFSGAPRDVEEALTEYGEKVGVAFQLSDDILDVASETEESGKTPGTDLREGVPTLPVLIAQRSTDPADARLLELLDADLTDDALHAEALALLRAHPAMAEARAYVVALAARGQGAAQGAPRGRRPHRPRGLRRRGRHPLELRARPAARCQIPDCRTGALDRVRSLARKPSCAHEGRNHGDVCKRATAWRGIRSGTAAPRQLRGPGGAPPPNHLVWAILSTLFCCLPLGIASIVFAAQVNSKWHAGDVAGAQESSKKARKFALWATIIGVVLVVLYLILLVVGAASSRCTRHGHRLLIHPWLSRNASRPPGPPGGARRCRVAVDRCRTRRGATLFAVDPNEPGHYPTCPFLATTGLYCPGCGALRGIHDLLHGDVAGALARNPMTVIAVPYLVLAWFIWVLRTAGQPAPRSTSLPPWTIWLLLGVVIAFGVLRNLPGWDLALPA